MRWRLVVIVMVVAGCSDDPLGPEARVGEWSQVAVGASHACGLTDAGEVFCWGATGSGQAGQTTGPVTEPSRLESDLVFGEIAAGGDTSCGISREGRLYCWGNNALGQLGDGTRRNAFLPVPVSEELTWEAVSVGTYHVCGIEEGGSLHCWGGDRWDSALGYPAWGECQAPAFEPTWPCQDALAPDLSPGTFEWVEAGLYQTCAGDGSGAVCWGTNDAGQLGTSTSELCAGNDPLHPSDRPCSRGPAAPDGQALDHIAPGATHSCGIAGDQAYCWGGLVLNFGQVGDGSLAGAAAPVAVASGGPWRSVFPSSEAHIRTFSCGLEEGGAARCWGANRFGQLGSADAPSCGDSSVPCRDTPTPVDGGYVFETLALGAEFACGLAVDGTIVCWGQNSDGQLGDGTLTARHEPRPVAP